jgi:pimeloyl-ACP methyl ester carboxylesterase
MFNKFLKIIMLVSVAACSSGSADKSSIKIPIDPNMPKKILLFIPGYYGSTLIEEKNNKVRWIKASTVLFSQTGVADEIPGTDIGSKNKLVVGGMLESVPVIPGIWEVNAYKKVAQLLEAFANTHKMKFETVSYDWRDDFVGNLKTIDEKIKSFNLKEEDELSIVAHSQGGLLMAYYLRYGAQDVDTAKENWEGTRHIKKLALIAPPLHGLMILFRDIGEGTSIGLNRSLLSARDYSTFKSSYFFLPPKGEDVGIKDDQKLSLGIHDIDKWQANKWGPFKFATASEVPTVRTFVEKYMKRSEKFHALLRAPVESSPAKKIPLLHMRGLGHKTLELARLKMKDGIIDYDFKKKDGVDGDGTVTAVSSAPLSYFKEFDFTTIDTKYGHLDVVAEPNAQSFIQEFLRK